ncbi:MAG: carbohydrate kinase [Treponema sp.]|jgi:fructokinase|nr:carbohydrate kinase [Treponema sp.]
MICRRGGGAFDVVALGELLIDFTYAGVSQNGMRLFEQNPGGAPANALIALANFGCSAAFIGKVGADMHGDFLRETLNGKHIDTSGLIVDEDAFTTLAFVSLNAAGERSFAFARKPGADTRLRTEELPRDIIERCGIFHFGSLSLTEEPARQATLEAVAFARASGAIVSYDPNYRAKLWRGEDEAIRMMRDAAVYADVIKLSEEEVPLLTGETCCEKGAEKLLERGCSCVAVTLGHKGAAAYMAKASAAVPARHVPVIDATGAGDAFWGGFLFQIVERGLTRNTLKDIDSRSLTDFVAFANAVAALCVQKRGGIPAMPHLEEVKRFLSENNNR